jgi:integrase/recombinase XerC
LTEALSRLFRESSPGAHEIVLGFRHYLLSASMAPASVNRHIAALRSVSQLARMLGLTSWFIEAPGVKAEKRRDTRGPTLADVRRMLEATDGDTETETAQPRDHPHVRLRRPQSLRALRPQPRGPRHRPRHDLD